ncbi:MULTISPECIES: hypothetical protein [Anaeromyxobacter]|uniref:hypothetical protein n=1 Tax=Anaeromyxobacter TaxID=161492 RepID=UPI001F5792B3|nr:MULTISPECIES: hypothetical protein [unclassified Anaeromyxobacter]
MTTSALLVALALTTSPALAPSGAAPRENLLRGPARVVLHYLDEVRLAGPRGPLRAGAAVPARAGEYSAATRLIAPRTRAELERKDAAGEPHPLAFWRDAARAHVLDSFQLLAVRRGPRATAVVTVEERYLDPAADARRLLRTVSEYLVARAGGEWRIVDRRPGGAFDAAAIAAYAGYWDEPASAAR